MKTCTLIKFSDDGGNPHEVKVSEEFDTVRSIINEAPANAFVYFEAVVYGIGIGSVTDDLIEAGPFHVAIRNKGISYFAKIAVQ